MSAKEGEIMLTERQIKILVTIIEEFVKSADPIGSRTLSKMVHLPYSPATIRNEMADLEELGYLEKTHSSSGRVPSEKGYRFYVDHIQNNQEFNSVEYTPINEIFNKKDIERDEAIKEAVKLLSDITNYTSINLGPSSYNSKVAKFQFVPLTEKNAVLVLITDNGHVESRNIILPDGINIKEVEKVINVMNETLVNCYVSDIPDKLNFEIKPYLKSFMDYHELLFDSILRAFSTIVNDQYYLSGRNNIFQQPEFQDIDKLQQLMVAFEDTNMLKIIKSDNNQMQIRIGHENHMDAMQDCTVITVPYQISDNEFGSIAVVGPTRMEYSKVIPLLEYIAKNISKLYK
ncbi:MAG: heat-inducible transcriptional repressor HrcA [Haloplasmataceae bacterium]|jgi:heat-inducible transcriptional repressor|nr:heat-inducible transcriptional repressor HrcA [Haloplasmataceae bacterium]